MIEQNSNSVRECGDDDLSAGRTALPGAYGFFARYVLLPWESVLDVGGGLGVGKAILLQRSKHVKSIDCDPRLTQYGVEHGDLRDESDLSYDWVIAIDVIEHIEDDAAFMQDLLRVARKGIFVTTPNLSHHPDLNWPYHVREYTRQAFHALFVRHAPKSHCWHFGGDVHCGHLSVQNEDPSWEHQGILCAKRKSLILSLILWLRERFLMLCNRK